MAQAARADTSIPNKSGDDGDGVPKKCSSNTTAVTEMKTNTTDEKLESISFKDVSLAKVEMALRIYQLDFPCLHHVTHTDQFTRILSPPFVAPPLPMTGIYLSTI